MADDTALFFSIFKCLRNIQQVRDMNMIHFWHESEWLSFYCLTVNSIFAGHRQRVQPLVKDEPNLNSKLIKI